MPENTHLSLLNRLVQRQNDAFGEFLVSYAEFLKACLYRGLLYGGFRVCIIHYPNGGKRNIVEKQNDDLFRVANLSCEWRHLSDRLLACVYRGEDAEVRIRAEEEELFRKRETEKRPLLIFRISRTEELIVLSHSSMMFENAELRFE